MHDKNYYENYHFDTTSKWTPSFNQLLSNSDNNPFNLTFKLPSQLRNIKKIYLKSVELPVGFTNIRSENQSDTLTIAINSISCTIKITSQNYIMSTLIDAINKAIVDSNIYINEHSNYLPIFSISGQNIVITTKLLLADIRFLSNTILTSVILGFPYNYSISLLNNSITSPSFYNLSYDTYLILNLPYVNHKSTSIDGKPISFKIPYSGSSNNIFFSAENTQFTQYIELTEDTFTLGNLKITVFDKYGFQLDNNGLDWSFSLQFLFHKEDHNKTNNFTNNEYLLESMEY